MCTSIRIHVTSQKNVNFYQNTRRHITENCTLLLGYTLHPRRRKASTRIHEITSQNNLLFTVPIVWILNETFFFFAFLFSTVVYFLLWEWMKNTDPFVRHIQHLQRRRNIVNVDFINVNIQHPLHFLPSSILRFIYLHSKVHYSVPLLHIHFPLLIPSFWLRSQNSKAVFFFTFSFFLSSSLAFSLPFYIFLFWWKW